MALSTVLEALAAVLPHLPTLDALPAILSPLPISPRPLTHPATGIIIDNVEATDTPFSAHQPSPCSIFWYILRLALSGS